MHHELLREPSILDAESLSEISNVRLSVIYQMAARPIDFYREFKILKRSGGARQISAPMPALKRVQKVILKNFLSCYRISDSAHAYMHSRSIISNARTHLGAKNILRIDIKDFFPSISLGLIYNVFSSANISKEMRTMLSLLCSLSGTAPQGAPTSPLLSNIIMRQFDDYLENYTSAKGLKYSRYADDLYISGEVVPLDVIGYVSQALSSYGFRINADKTCLMTEGRMIVTGISVSSGSMKLPRSTKRDIRNQAEIYSKFGILGAPEPDPFKADRILGTLYFWKSIEPENARVGTLIARVKRRMRQDYLLAQAYLSDRGM